jgi:hypothetical protein
VYNSDNYDSDDNDHHHNHNYYYNLGADIPDPLRAVHLRELYFLMDTAIDSTNPKGASKLVDTFELSIVKLDAKDIGVCADSCLEFHREAKIPGEFDVDVFIEQWGNLIDTGIGAVFVGDRQRRYLCAYGPPVEHHARGSSEDATGSGVQECGSLVPKGVLGLWQ